MMGRVLIRGASELLTCAAEAPDLIGRVPGGSVLIEFVLDWPGIGQYALKAALVLDFQPIMGATLFIGCVVVIVNLITDVLYRLIDPRIRFA